MRPILPGLAICLLAYACGQRPPAPQAQGPTPTNEAAAATTSEPDMAGVLAELTQALRRFSAEKQQVPASLEPLVASGYLAQLPQAPPGKMFAVDQKNVRVILK